MVERVWPFAPPRRRWPFPGSLSPSEVRSLWSGLRRRDFWAGARLLERPAWLSDSPPEGRVVTLEPLLMRTWLSLARVWESLAVQGTHLFLLWFDFYFHLPKCTSIYFFTWENQNTAFQDTGLLFVGRSLSWLLNPYAQGNTSEGVHQSAWHLRTPGQDHKGCGTMSLVTPGILSCPLKGKLL